MKFGFSYCLCIGLCIGLWIGLGLDAWAYILIRIV